MNVYILGCLLLGTLFMITFYRYRRVIREVSELEESKSRILGTYHNLFQNYIHKNDLYEMYRDYYKHTMLSEWCMDKVKAIKSIDSLTRLISFLKDVDYKLDDYDKTALLINSIRINNFEMFKYLMLKHNCKLIIPDIMSKDMTDSYNCSVLMEILRNDNNDEINPFIKFLVEACGLNVNKELFTKNNILYKAIFYDNIGIVRYLIEVKHMKFKIITGFEYPVKDSKCYEYLLLSHLSKK